MAPPTKINRADLTGILSSSLCLIHCIATPLLITLGVGIFTHPLVKYLFLIIAFISIIKATQHTTDKRISYLLWFSFTGFFTSNILHHQSEWFHYAEYLFALMIITGHILNIKNCKYH